MCRSPSSTTSATDAVNSPLSSGDIAIASVRIPSRFAFSGGSASPLAFASSDETTNPQDNKPDAKPADPEPANDSAESTKDTQPDAKPSENAEPKSELDKQRDALLERLKEQGMPEEKIKQLEQVMKENPDAIQHISDKVDELQGMTPEEAAQAQEEMQNELAQLQKESDEAKARGEALPPEKAKRLGILKGLLLTVGIILAAGFVGTALVATTAASMGGGRR